MNRPKASYPVGGGVLYRKKKSLQCQAWALGIFLRHLRKSGHLEEQS